MEKEYMLKKEIKIGNHSLLFSYNPTVNLFIHTMNLYGLLGHHCTTYELRSDKDATAAVNPDLAEAMKDGDWYFSYGKHGVYCPGMETIMAKKLYHEYPDDKAMDFCVNDSNFEPAFRTMWQRFYQNYWKSNLINKKPLFNNCIDYFNWEGLLTEMQKAAQRLLETDIFVFPVDAAGSSGLTFSDNIILGALKERSDMYVVHEGLHLLLGEKWSDDERIKEYFASHPFNDKLYKNYKQKYEQILVLTLEHIILKKENDLKDACVFCEVDDILPTAYPVIRAYSEGRYARKLEEVMYDIIAGNDIVNNKY